MFRWGTRFPTFQQPTTIHVISSLVSSDLVYLDPLIKSPQDGAIPLIFSCDLGATQIAWSGVIATLVPKSQSGAQLLAATFTAGDGGSVTPVRDQLLVNATHPSHAWVMHPDATPANGPDISQPLTGYNGVPVAAPVEVDTWAVGDAITAYTPSSIFPVEALPTCNANAYPVDFPMSVTITGCNFSSTGVGGNDNVSFVANQYVQLTDIVSTRTQQDTTIGPNTGGPAGPQNVNVYYDTLYRGIGGRMIGGAVGTGSKFAMMQGGSFDDDIVFYDTLYMSGVNVAANEGSYNFGSVYINLGQSLDLDNGYAVVKGPIWGGGIMRVEAGGFLQYPSGAGKAVATFLNNPGLGDPLFLSGGTGACSMSISVGSPTIHCGIGLTPTNLDTCPVSSSAFCGYAFSIGGATITNVVQ